MRCSKKVSIILPVYNGEKYLEKSIESCLNQTYDNVELIIVNDASTDRSLSIVEAYQKKHSNIIIINNEKNLQLPKSLNVGLLKANGTYLTWTSDDNIYSQNAIEVLVKNIEASKSDIVCANYKIINQDSNIIGERVLEAPENIFFLNCMGACFLFKKNVFTKLQGYNENLFLIEDYDFWIRAKIYDMRFSKINEFLYSYRVHENSLTSQKQEQINEVLLNYYKNLFNFSGETTLKHFRYNMLAQHVSKETLITISREWFQILKTLSDKCNVDFITISKFLLTRKKYHIILILILKQIVQQFTLEANNDFFNFYADSLHDINKSSTDSKSIIIIYQENRFDITLQDDLQSLLKTFLKSSNNA